MPVAPILEKQSNLQGYSTPEVQYQRPTQGIGAGLEVVGRAAEDFAGKAIQRGNEVRMIEAQRALDEWEAKSLFDPSNGAFAKRGKDAFGIPETVQKSYTDFVDQYKSTLSNEDQMLAFDKMTTQRWGNIAPRVQTHVRGEMDSYSAGQAKATVESGVNRAALYWNDDKTVDETIKSIESVIEAQGISRGLSAEEIASDKAKAASAARMSQLSMLSDRDPRRALDYANKHMAGFYGEDIVRAQKLVSTVREAKEVQDVIGKVAGSAVVGQDSVIDFVMNQLEGGEKVHIDSDGGTTKFGINHLHNEMKPEEVAKLSPEQAMAHYKEKYWKPMGIDNMSPDMQIVAFDAAVQHGADADTKKMIEESGGDAEKLIELRRDYYLQLAKQNPEKNGPQLRGWMNRLGQIKSQVEAARGAMPTLEEAYAQIDANTTNPEVATKAKAEYKSRLDAFEGARKQREDDAARQVAEYESRGETPPATLLAEMNPQKQIDRQKKDYDPKEYERVRTQISYGQPIDLEQYRWRMPADQFAELAQAQADPLTQVRLRTIDEAAKDNVKSVVGRAVSEFKSNEDFERYNRYRQTIASDVAAYEKASNKQATSDDIEKIADRIAKVTEGGIFSYGVDDIEGIPKEKSFKTKGGASIDYAALVRVISDDLRKRGLKVTPEAVSARYLDAVERGLISVMDD